MYSIPFRRNKLALAATLLFGVSTSTTFAATHYLSSCSDSGSGSLRSVVAAAQTGDTIELTETPSGTSPILLPCSQITLTTGAIAITQHDLTIDAPFPITVAGQEYSDRVFYHSGTGALTLHGFTVSKGYAVAVKVSQDEDLGLGGCILSKGDLRLENMHVSRCQLSSSSSDTYLTFLAGAGTASYGETQLLDSVITQSSINSAPMTLKYSRGAGLYARGSANIQNSTISGNGVYYSPNVIGYGTGCGAFVLGDLYIIGSTIDNNKCSGSALYNKPYMSLATSATLVESTISQNSGAAAASIIASSITMANSTVAYNLNNGLELNYFKGSTGSPTAYPVTMFSDIVVAPDGTGVISSENILGANNFVTRTQTPSFPTDTKATGCLWLGPLKNNGGQTQTHALMSHSVAIDAGNTTYPDQTEDQRGLPRTSGPAPDIGALEVQQNDVIFNTEFESCI